MAKKELDSEYPTKEQILANLPKTDKAIIDILRDWMATSWQKAKTKGEEHKFFALVALIKQIAKYLKKPVKVEYRPTIGSCYYQPSTKTIFLNNSLSIISSLHELAHHLFGHSELSACSWSVAYFKAAFPKSFDKLEWEGHLLIKKR